MKKKVAGDVLINLVAASLCTATLNLIVYPLYAKAFTEAEYGHILTIIGAVNLLWAVSGNCLNNTRLILNKNNEVSNESGNYNPLLCIALIISGIVIAIIVSFFSITTIVSTILVILTVLVGVARAYYVVIFRLKLDYVTQLKTNVIVSVGYVVGILLTKTIDLWPLSLLLGEGIALIYTILKSDLIKEPFKFTEDKRIVSSTYCDLILVGLIGNIIAYFDRFLINPLLGPSSVAIFTVASFWGKAVTPFIAPTANVMLSYLSQKDSKVTLKKFFVCFLASVLPLLLFGLVGVWVAPWITGLLYPTLIEQALPFIVIASMGALIQSSTNLLMPLLLTVCSSRTILLMHFVYFIFYLGIAFVGTKAGGLMGFCVANCIIGIVKVVLYFVFGYSAMKREGNTN